MASDLKPTNPKDRAANHRLDLSLFPTTALAYGALAMTEGDAKYGGYNYRVGGVLASVYVAALFRHVSKWYNGELADPKTRIPHLASALACLAVLIDAIEVGVLKDDRPPKVAMNKLLSEFEVIVKHLHELFPDGPSRFTEVNDELRDNTRPSSRKKAMSGLPAPRTDYIKTLKGPKRAKRRGSKKR